MNPITQMLNVGRSNGILNQVSMIKGMMGRNPDALYQQLMNSNPKFREFVQQNQGKRPEQILSDYGFDPSILSQIL